MGPCKNATGRGTPFLCWSLDPAGEGFAFRLFDMHPFLRRVVDSVFETVTQVQGSLDESIKERIVLI